MKSMKYMGAPTDDGEWWSDRRSNAVDLGPAVAFTVRVADDEHTRPHLIHCYGLREDVVLERVIAEAERIVDEYKRIEGRQVYGDLKTPTLERWRSIEDVMILFRKAVAKRHAEGMKVGGWWSPDGIREILFDCTGSYLMAQRVVERVGIETLREIILPPPKVMARWPFVAISDGKPACFLETEASEIPYLRRGNVVQVRSSKAEDIWEM